MLLSLPLLLPSLAVRLGLESPSPLLVLLLRAYLPWLIFCNTGGIR